MPLRSGGHAAGVVARSTRYGRVIGCYFFGPRLDIVPSLEELGKLKPQDVLCILRIGDLHLIDGKWQIHGRSPSWKREEWPLPQYIRREEFTNRAFRVYYSDKDPNQVIRETPISREDATLQTDSMFGAGAAEGWVDMLLLADPEERKSLITRP